MVIGDKIRDEKLQRDFNREAAKTSAWSSGKADKHQYFTGEKILPSDQRRVIAEAKFTYSPLRTALEKNKINWRSRDKCTWKAWKPTNYV